MMITAARFSFPYEAHIARAKLESEGIPAVVADEHTINMQWLYSDALGGVKVQVPESLLACAQEILAHDDSEVVVEQEGEDLLCCPVCGSEQAELQIRGRRPAFFVFAVLQFPFWPFRRQVKCEACGKLSDYHPMRQTR